MSRKVTEFEPKFAEIIALGSYRFAIESKELTDPSGERVALRSQSADVLAYLAAHAGELVSKDALMDAVWNDTFVTDDSLVQCVGDIRRAIGDDARRIVQTIPRKGYRLVPTESTAPLTGRGWKLQPLHLVGALVLIAVIGIAYWLNFSGAGPSHPPGDKPKIAVLPFDDFSAGDDKGYLSDAIAEGIITELARNPLIAVTARNSSFRYRDASEDMRKIGEELGVHYVLEGSKQKNGDALKVTVQLIDATSGDHLWAHTYDQKIEDLFSVQDTIIKTVANRIGVRIEKPVPGADPERVTALHLHLKGVEVIRESFNEEVNAQLIDLNRQAIQIDPDAVYGYIGLAHAYRNAGTFSWHGLNRNEALSEGLGYIDKALEIAPQDAGVHYAHARLLNETGDLAEAMASYDKAISLNPSASNYLVASTSIMLYRGETEDAIARLNQAMGIDPFHDDWFHWQMGWALWEIEDCEGALAAMLKMNKIRRGAHRMLAGIYACLGDVEKAQQAYKVFYAEADEPTISEQRVEWQDIWTAPGSLDRWLDHMRIAGMRD